MIGPIVMDAVRRFYLQLPLPPATKALFAINVVVFFANALLLGRLSEPDAGAWFAFSWPGLWDGYGLGLLRVISYQFTHSFSSPMHVLMNMISLWVFGPNGPTLTASARSRSSSVSCAATAAVTALRSCRLGSRP